MAVDDTHDVIWLAGLLSKIDEGEQWFTADVIIVICPKNGHFGML